MSHKPEPVLHEAGKDPAGAPADQVLITRRQQWEPLLGQHEFREKQLLCEEEPIPARLRLASLLDAQSVFQERGLFAHEQGGNHDCPRAPADGVVTGFGFIQGTEVAVVSDDGTSFGGSRSKRGALKVDRLQQAALARGTPYVALMEASAGRIPDMLEAGVAGGEGFVSFYRLAKSVPTVAAILGKAFGGPAFQAALSHFIVQVRGKGYLGMSGPAVVQGGTRGQANLDDLGGPDVHAARTGVVDQVVDSEEDALRAIREFIGLATHHHVVSSDPVDRDLDAILDIVPPNPQETYDMRGVLRLLVDDGRLFEYKPLFGKGLITCLVRFAGHVAGVVANQPKVLAGCLGPDETQKLTRFIRVCSQLGIPVVYLQDVPGFLIGKHVEQAGQLARTADLLAATLDAAVPRITVVLRKGYGMAYLVLGAHGLGGDLVYAWPTAELGLMGAESAALVVTKSRASAEKLNETTRHYRSLTDVYDVAARAQIDGIIAPRDTRRVLCDALAHFSRNRLPGPFHE